MLEFHKLQTLLDQFSKLRIGLIGDLFLDRYLDINPDVYELSVETDLEAYQVQEVRNAPGALGTVMNNLAAIGIGQLVPVTVIGNDGHGFDLLKALSHLPVETSHILERDDRLTPTYTKPMQRSLDGQWCELNRLDVRHREPLNPAATKAIQTHISEVFQSTDGMIVLDQINEPNWGVVNSQVRTTLRELQASQPDKLIFIDSRTQIQEFDFGILKSNHHELMRAVSMSETAEKNVAQAACHFSQRTDQPVFCTLGEKGIVIGYKDQPAIHVPGFSVAGPIDIVGAGDSATAGTVASLLAGATDSEAATVGNLVASITIQQLGTTGIATPAQILSRWRETRA